MKIRKFFGPAVARPLLYCVAVNKNNFSLKVAII